MQAKILLIEDESLVRLGLEENLKFEGYDVVACDNGASGLDAYKNENPDLVVLDVMMPGVDGLEVCRLIRASGRFTPVIMLTARCAEVDKVVGLEIGADDYLTKPFGVRELCARIKALLRRTKSNEAAAATPQVASEQLTVGGVVVDFKAYRARRGEKELILSAKEFELLKFLANNADIPVTRDQLLDQVWGYNSYPTTRTVDNFIARLRQKIEDVPDKPKYILTVHGVGYKFVHQPV